MSNTTVNPVSTPKSPLLSDAVYNKLEYVARIVLPALAVLYGALAVIWHVAYGPEVVGTIVAVDTFLGVFVGVAQKSYDASDAKYDGTVTVTPSTDGSNPTLGLSALTLSDDPANLSKLVLKVLPASS